MSRVLTIAVIRTFGTDTFDRRRWAADPITAKGQTRSEKVVDGKDSAMSRWLPVVLLAVVSDDFFETNQNGNSRNKAQMLDLWSTFKITSLSTDRATIRMSGDTATITGQQTEVNGTGTDRMLFARVYVKDKNANWRLLSSTQFRDPQQRSAEVR